MSEHDDRVIEALLQRYRPMDAAARIGRTWRWAVAAAALLAITIGLHALAIPGGVKPAAVDPTPLAEQLGGDALAYDVANAVIASETPRATGAEQAGDTAWIR